MELFQVVLSACSTYFDTILSQYEEKDPIVIMRDVKFSDIKVLVEFMYKGEINIDHVSDFTDNTMKLPFPNETRSAQHPSGRINPLLRHPINPPDDFFRSRAPKAYYLQ